MPAGSVGRKAFAAGRSRRIPLPTSHRADRPSSAARDGGALADRHPVCGDAAGIPSGARRAMPCAPQRSDRGAPAPATRARCNLPPLLPAASRCRRWPNIAVGCGPAGPRAIDDRGAAAISRAGATAGPAAPGCARRPAASKQPHQSLPARAADALLGTLAQQYRCCGAACAWLESQNLESAHPARKQQPHEAQR